MDSLLTVARSRDRIALPSSGPGNPTQAIYDYVLLGAGCAGLSLACHMREAGMLGPIALIDRRASYENDRTWCFWNVGSVPFNHLATHHWSRWQVIDEQGRVAEASSNQYSYLRIRSIDFYRHALARLNGYPCIDFYPGSCLQSIIESDDRVSIQCENTTIAGQLAFQSVRRPPTQAVASKQAGPHLYQRSLGQTVIAPRPSFDPECPILMDFRVSQRYGPHFMYLLPLAPDTALVESTYFCTEHLPPDLYRSDVRTYLSRCFGLDHYELIEEETGLIPMSTSLSSHSSPNRTIPIGLVAGAARPSSGYAFARIQRQTAAIAAALAHGNLAQHLRQPRLAPAKYDFLDGVFLSFLADTPTEASKTFFRLFRHVPDDSLVRFMCDQSTLADDFFLIMALSKLKFMKAMLRWRKHAS